ncbi:CDP-diacylglycerol--serine O-phosphatidyltransferase [Actinokineospora auranticolor]|uniref:CDP-diacylglycerol--serine O-phosphatidyltransferase n=1 Tax=Actinokineospora auranticolor TaxID=155976 RepID=A0A2S6GZB2_9PSEU|nr:CDP-diacylglycerol--serine O-phosphatidyltransferase [Actinokineospora auranticolor]PPK70574.1 CDP-diacylglycerol--serine O-phosphatidyltransferase [Actinokineospora auranticolor]
MAPTAPGVRLLPNALTVLAMCAGLSAVQFTLNRQYSAAIAAIAIAAVLDSLDGRIARLLDATSKMGAELDSLADAISFGVAPALMIYIWRFGGDRVGWVVALVFAVCMILRLARFNTLLDDSEQPLYAKEFFVGVPAPAGGLLALVPLILTNEFGDHGHWWQSKAAVMVWTVAIAALLISRIPTLSVKTIKVSPRAVAPLLVGVGLLAAAVITYPQISLCLILALYLLHIPYAVRRKQWLAKHPEAWAVPPSERRAIRRAHGSSRRLGLRPPLRRVAGAARRAVMRPIRNGDQHQIALPKDPRPVPRTRGWRRTGLRKHQRPGESKTR